MDARKVVFSARPAACFVEEGLRPSNCGATSNSHLYVRRVERRRARRRVDGGRGYL